MVIFPLRKQKSRYSCNFFAIADSLLSVQSTNWLPISRFAALWRPAAIPNRKKVAIRGVFLFFGSLDRLKRCSGMNLGPAREQGGPGGAAGDFGRVLGWSARVQRWAALGTGPLAGIMEWYRACVINEVFGLNAGCLEKEMPPKGTALKCE